MLWWFSWSFLPLFCKPVLDGNVLNQHDNVGWKGMAQNAFEYKEKNGHYPLVEPQSFQRYA
ncbi:MAG: hypothetical protein V9F01_04680 [Chitinophagaceae bacterium]